MNTQSNQGFIFGSEIITPVQWRSHLTSMAVHIVALLILLLVPIAITHETDQRIRNTTTLIAPQLKPYKPETPKIRVPRLLAKSIVIPKPLVPPPHAEVKPPVPAPALANIPKPVIQPQLAAAEPKPLPRVVTPEIAPAPAIKPQVHTGLFGSEDAAKKVEAAKELKVGGFGDPNGAKAARESKSTLVASVGSFEMPQGEGNNGGRGGAGRGVIHQTSFGSAEGAGSGPGGNGLGSGHGVIRQAGFGATEGGGGAGTGGNGRGGSVKTGGFGEAAGSAPVQQAQRLKPAAPSVTPVEIISKPKPLYTQEAREMRLEGEVSLEVVFSASGTVQVLRIVQGLGHGLDQSAQQAAAQIRFRPGTRDGVAVDTRATIHIVFELS